MKDLYTLEGEGIRHRMIQVIVVIITQGCGQSMVIWWIIFVPASRVKRLYW